MADIISLDNKLRLEEGKKAALIRKRKILAVQKVFQCTHCAFKCEKCGTQISLADHRKKGDKTPYRFCESCLEEYIEYTKRLKKKGDRDCYWRKKAWLEVWEKWIEYRNAIDRYLKSEEFRDLLQELKQSSHNKPNK